MSESVSGNARTLKPSRPGSGILGDHPQRQLMIDRLLAGEKPGVIYREFTPPVSKVSVTLLAKQVRQQAQDAAVLAKAQALSGITQTVGQSPESLAKFTRDAVMGQQHLSRIREHQDRTSRLLVQAEANGDIGSVATLIKTDYQGIRLAAELDGSLSTLSAAPQTTVNTQIIVLPAFTEEDEAEVIDVHSESV